VIRARQRRERELWIEGDGTYRIAVREVIRHLLQQRRRPRPVVDGRLQAHCYRRHRHRDGEVSTDDHKLTIARTVAKRGEFHWPFQLST
jgi:hypothetical protein